MKTLENRSNFGATLAEAEQHLANMEPFHTGTMSASFRDEPTYAFGSDYVVYSYGVPIAFAVYDPSYGFTSVMMAENAYEHSVTTSKHANIVKKAWGL